MPRRVARVLLSPAAKLMTMVGVAQLAERQVVVLDVVGSSPITHPIVRTGHGPDITRVANKYVDPSKLGIVVVGNQPDIKPPLSELGKVTDLDITIPPPPGKPGQ